MFRQRMLIALMLLGCGIATLRNAAVSPSIIGQAPPVVPVVQTSGDVAPDSVRGFDVNTPVGMNLLDQRAEVLFDD